NELIKLKKKNCMITSLIKEVGDEIDIFRNEHEELKEENNSLKEEIKFLKLSNAKLDEKSKNLKRKNDESSKMNKKLKIENDFLDLEVKTLNGNDKSDICVVNSNSPRERII